MNDIYNYVIIQLLCLRRSQLGQKASKENFLLREINNKFPEHPKT